MMGIRVPGGIWRAGAPVYLETVGDLPPLEHLGNQQDSISWYTLFRCLKILLQDLGLVTSDCWALLSHLLDSFPTNAILQPILNVLTPEKS